ncbi:MAG: orotidine-5'-phosphate decarboxylase, partial [Pseudobdellovibrionaceae bacterium]
MKDLNKKASPLNNPLILALDVDTLEKATQIADDIKDLVGGIKLGPRLINRYGGDLIKKMADKAPVFVDCKYFDIPSTMEAAVRSAFDCGASLVTVHALSGKEALTQLAALEAKLNQTRPFKILCVTILTSWDQNSLPSSIQNWPIKKHVSELADLANLCGLKGLVCSAEELDLFENSDHYLVIPGIRLSLQEKGDQKRTKTPADAMKAGASALVVGRPIVEAAKPREMASDFL